RGPQRAHLALQVISGKSSLQAGSSRSEKKPAAVQRLRHSTKIHRLTTPALPTSLLSRHPVELFLQRFLIKTGPREDTFDILDHMGIATKICRRISGPKPQGVKIFPHHVVGTAHFACPGWIRPGTADGGVILKPGARLGISGKFVAVSQFVG